MCIRDSAKGSRQTDYKKRKTRKRMQKTKVLKDLTQLNKHSQNETIAQHTLYHIWNFYTLNCSVDMSVDISRVNSCLHYFAVKKALFSYNCEILNCK